MSDRDEDIYQAASMYYVQGETMDNIARRLDVSRSTVSRMLATARASGVVRITLSEPTQTRSALASTLHKIFGVTPHVVSVKGGSSDVIRLDRVARVAAGLVTEAVQPDSVVSVAWGSTLAAVAAHMPARDLPGVRLVQSNGAGSPVSTGIPYAGAILGTMADAWGAQVHQFPVPAFFDYAETRQAMWRERSVHRMLALQDQADVAVFGVGSLEAKPLSYVYAAGYLSEEDLEELRAERVVGDIATVLLREDGSWRDIALNARASGPSPSRLRRIPRRYCVVATATKVPALLGALRAGVATDLVIDDGTARELLARLHR